MSHPSRHIVIAGGGVAAIETLLALGELAAHRAHVTLISPDRDFLYRPVTVGEAFDRSEARGFSLSEIIGRREQDRFLRDTLAEVRVSEHVVLTAQGREVHYDALVVAAGAIARDPLPGALTFRGRPDVDALRGVLEELERGPAASVAFTLPGARMWPLPIYELTLMAAWQLRAGGSEAKVWLITPEEEPLALFGPAAKEAITPMLERLGVTVRTSTRSAAVRGRALVLFGGGEIYVDRVVTVPQLEGPRIDGLPHDERGFIPVDSHGRVAGADGVYAAGDVTAFPLKQGGLAAQQADAVAETIAATLGVPIEPTPFRPVLRGLLMTGGAPLYLRAEPHLLDRPSSVAIEAARFRRPDRALRASSSAAGQPLWWPPAKIAGRYLSPYFATARPHPLGTDPLTDRVAVAGRSDSGADQADALELALLLAECDARWGDYRAALQALDAAEALEGALPPEYEAKRRMWTAAAKAA